MKSMFRIIIILGLLVVSQTGSILAQDYNIIESDNQHIILEFNYNNQFSVEDFYLNGIKFTKVLDVFTPVQTPGNPLLPTRFYNIGIPLNAKSVIRVLEQELEVFPDKFIMSTPDSMNQPHELLKYNEDIYGNNSLFPIEVASINSEGVYRYIKLSSLLISPFQFNPVERTLVFNKRIKLRVDFVSDNTFADLIEPVTDKSTLEYLSKYVVNPYQSENFISKTINVNDSPTEEYWYNPNKNYYKIFLNKKGVYRVTYDELIASGISPTGGIQDGKLELFNDGISLPLDIVDSQNDGFFNSGDYFQFVGKPATPHDAYTRMNIYNLTNVYWFSYQADTVNNYKSKNAYSSSNITPLITNTVETLRWEKDSSYQKLGYAIDGNRDYWYWGSAEARNRTPFRDFRYNIEDSIAYKRVLEKHDVKIRIGMHGLSNISCVGGNGHDVTIKFNTKTLGNLKWNGQSGAIFEKSFFVSPNTQGGGDTAQLFLDQQKLEIILYGDICPNAFTDYVLINYIEFDYWRWNRTYSNYYFFKSPPNNYAENRYYLFGWGRDNMKIYIPSRSLLLSNPFIQNDADKSVYFNDTVSVQTEYYCVADDYFLPPDSIKEDNSSNLRDINNGSDYIIITHSNFIDAAENLASFREENLKGVSSPRIKVVDVNDIYDEFSYGLMNPYALNYFAKYAFDNWQQPAPQYIVLLGDMSYDYRKIFSTSRDNFIPSIPYHAPIYGQAPSDNAIVTVSGNDLIPDIAIGRISCEDTVEANVLINKITSYPADQTKEWKQNVLLMSSGLSADDENQMKFNDRNVFLENTYLKPYGIKATKIFRYPNKPEYIPFQGEGPDIRREIDNGAVLSNYYGHGGGLQWDLVFTNDDILELNNGGRLTFVSSITCYTSHYDNQEIFGEIFNSIPDKGSIAFWGSSGVTFWPTAAYINERLFSDLFVNKDYVIGDAINVAKANQVASSMNAVLTLLGDPAIELALPYKPDFVVKPSNITISPINPLVSDSVNVKVIINNLGRTFPEDSVEVRLYERIVSDSTLIGMHLLPNFGEIDSAIFVWYPQTSGLINLLFTINENQSLDEEDFSDNSTSASFSVFDFGEPSIIKPIDGYSTDQDNIDFLISDVGFYFERDFNYVIQIFNSPESENQSVIKVSPILKGVDALVKWNSGVLAKGEYFWKAIIYDEVDTNYSQMKSFSILDENHLGYIAKKMILKQTNSTNIGYSNDDSALVLNTDIKPPYPSPKFLEDSIYFDIPPDNTEPSVFTSDGTFLYFGNLPSFSNGAPSKIYKIGSGLNGTIKGDNYGAIPNLDVAIESSLMMLDNYLYVGTGSMNSLLKIDPLTGDTNSVFITDSLLLTLQSPTQIGGIYLYTDGQYVYNLGIGTSLHPNNFVLRTLDPNNGWGKVREDIIFNGNILNRVGSFIISQNYLIVYENYTLIKLRRYRLTDGQFEEEWWYAPKIKDYYSIAYDYLNNFVYFNTFRPGSAIYTPAFFKYTGTYVEANGSITFNQIGPAVHWNEIDFEIDQTNSNGVYKPYLYGKIKNSENWVLLDSAFSTNYDLSNINPDQYNYLKVRFDLADSSFGAGEPMKFRSLKLLYTPLAEVSIIPKNMYFTPDTVLQGIPLDLNLELNNIGYTEIDSLKLDFYDDLSDSIFYSTTISLPLDTTTKVSKNIISDNLLYTAPISPINVTVTARSSTDEFYTFNNQTTGSFYVTRDSIRPNFTITFDGNELIDGDVISSEPEVIMTLEDNSPLPLSPNLFSIQHNNETLNFYNTSDSLFWDYTPYPNSKATVKWRPKLQDGLHTLSVFVKDSSGNPFNTTQSVFRFYVYNNPDLVQVYNYPNPFKDKTEFTFEVRGILAPEEVKIKVFSVAGRLIRELIIPGSDLQIGFNRIAWDGKDQDGDEIANGVYFYKLISKHGDETKVTTQKLAKLK